MKNSDILRVLSPLVLFVFHVTYLIVWSPDSFLEKWIDGSFTFFIALVLCNIIRANVVAKGDLSDTPDESGQGQDDPEEDGTP